MKGVVLRPRRGLWPFSGYFSGSRNQICWAGRVGNGLDSKADWDLSQHFRRQLSGLSELSGDKKAAVATFLSVLTNDVMREFDGEHLSVLVAAWDEAGVAISGFGCSKIIGMSHPGASEVWLEGDHPLLSRPGWPSVPLGALVVPTAPEWLVGVVEPEDDEWRGVLSGDVLAASGVVV